MGTLSTTSGRQRWRSLAQRNRSFMELTELAAQIPSFGDMPPRKKISLFGWFLHTCRGVDTFDNAAIRDCFRKLGLAVPDVAVYLPRMAESRSPELIRERGAYKLERATRLALDAKYGRSQSVVAVSGILAGLPGKVLDRAERVFLMETLDCYKARAYRAAIVMVWNLAYYHLLGWIVADAKRLSDFNTALPTRFPKKTTISVSRIEDFEELKEADVVEVCRTAKLLSKNTVEILREKLKRRNLAAHPSQIVVTQHQADDAITDLANNAILALV
jgi:hypothetical protein